MIEEAITKIEELIEARETVIDINKQVYLLRQADGSFAQMTKPLDELRPVSVEALEIGTLVKQVKAEDCFAEVFVSPKKVIAVCEQDDIRWSHTMNLPYHPAFQKLDKWLTTGVYTQLELLTLLRSQFKGFIDKNAVDELSVLKISSKSSSEQASTTDYSKLGKDIEAQIRTATGQRVPEELVFNIPVYDTPNFRDERYEVDVLLQINPLEGSNKIELTTVHNDLSNAQYLAMCSVQEVAQSILDNEGNVMNEVQVYLGIPTL